MSAPPPLSTSLRLCHKPQKRYPPLLATDLIRYDLFYFLLTLNILEAERESDILCMRN